MISFKSLSELKEFITGNKDKIPFIDSLFLILNFVKENPTQFMECGVLWLNGNIVFYHQKNLPKFMLMTLKRLNLCFRKDGFVTKLMPVASKRGTQFPIAAHVPDTSNWTIRVSTFPHITDRINGLLNKEIQLITQLDVLRYLSAKGELDASAQVTGDTTASGAGSGPMDGTSWTPCLMQCELSWHESCQEMEQEEDQFFWQK